MHTYCVLHAMAYNRFLQSLSLDSWGNAAKKIPHLFPVWTARLRNGEVASIPQLENSIHGAEIQRQAPVSVLRLLLSVHTYGLYSCTCFRLSVTLQWTLTMTSVSGFFPPPKLWCFLYVLKLTWWIFIPTSFCSVIALIDIYSHCLVPSLEHLMDQESALLYDVNWEELILRLMLQSTKNLGILQLFLPVWRS